MLIKLTNDEALLVLGGLRRVATAGMHLHEPMSGHILPVIIS
jgi:hypothetical protein